MSALDLFQPAVKAWFETALGAPTVAQEKGWPPIARGESTLLLAPTGSGKTLAAFLAALDRLVHSPEPDNASRCSVLYVSPLKALATDVERNLRAPLAGITAAAARLGIAHRIPTLSVRSGDTPQNERARTLRHPPDILITTPESLFLLLTSASRRILASIDTVIVDEIHALVGSKRGAHLFLSLERLAALRPAEAKPLQRIGLSATQRPLDEVARLLAGFDVEAGQVTPKPRPVTIVDGSAPKAWDLRVEVPVDDMALLGEPIDEVPSGPASMGQTRRSIWPAIHPRLVELVRAHRSTLIFTNSRRLAERLAGALNEVAGEDIALAHHGSVAKEQRQDIEDRLKRGELPALVATSSLELGIDMGAIDLVVQIEAPPSVASGIQRIGRAGHTVGATSRGVLFPKYRGDLLTTAAAVEGMRAGAVEQSRYLRNPLDIVAQQIVAMTALDTLEVRELYALIRRAAPFAELPLGAFEGVLDMLSGRYPSDEFAELRPRIVWDRLRDTVRGKNGTQRLAVTSGGTIPDRGLYGVYLASGDAKSKRVGELDEEMVFESRAGEVFLLGATSWRIEEITHDRVLVSPAPGEPGKMPFWKGDRVGRPVELGRALGALTREVAHATVEVATKRLQQRAALDDRAAQNLIAYVTEQLAATGEVPSDRTIIIERTRDELGDHRVCLLSPFGARVHAPWASAVLAKWEGGPYGRIEALWSDDGITFRFPESDEPPPSEVFLPDADDVEQLVVRGLGKSSLFAARFRENAGRALLLPRRSPGKRVPLWAQRKRASDLLEVASHYPSFPILLETYRECLRDVFDLPALVEILASIATRKLRVRTVDTARPSPFAASLMFSYVASYLYDGDVPLAERRAQALTVDTRELGELLGASELRELFDADVIAEHEAHLQRLDAPYPLRGPDDLVDLLLYLGDLTREEVALRGGDRLTSNDIGTLLRDFRVVELRIAGDVRLVAAEDAARYRDALGAMLPAGMPIALLAPVEHALVELVARYARTHGPFPVARCAARFGLGVAPVRSALAVLMERGRVIEGELLPGHEGREHCDVEVLRTLKRRTLARLRREVEPVEQAAFARFCLAQHGITRPRAGLEAVLSVVEHLQGSPLPASIIESDVFAARIEGYRPSDLDTLAGAGEIAWTGAGSLGPNDGRIALYLTDELPQLAPAAQPVPGDLAARLRALFEARGALFFQDIDAALGAFRSELVEVLWDMVWAGEVTNDSFMAVRSRLFGERLKDRHQGFGFRSRRRTPPGTEGRFSLVRRIASTLSPTAQVKALAERLLARHGVLTREAVAAEGIVGGFSSIYPVLKAMEEAGRVRRGYFVEGLGATQFAEIGAEERLRAERERPEQPQVVVLAAADPANPYGGALPWPERQGSRPQRVAGAHVVLVDGALAGFLGRAGTALLTFLPADEPDRSRTLHALAAALAAEVERGRRKALLLNEIDGVDAASSFAAPALVEAGFQASTRGLLKRPSLHARSARRLL